MHSLLLCVCFVPLALCLLTFRGVWQSDSHSCALATYTSSKAQRTTLSLCHPSPESVSDPAPPHPQCILSQPLLPPLPSSFLSALMLQPQHQVSIVSLVCLLSSSPCGVLCRVAFLDHTPFVFFSMVTVYWRSYKVSGWEVAWLLSLWIDCLFSCSLSPVSTVPSL